MCGIFGIVGSGPVSARELARMSQVLRHRGPDDEGFLLVGPAGTDDLGGCDTPVEVLRTGLAHFPAERLDESRTCSCGVALGHRRLSILDLSPQGHQPMWYRDRLALVFNGEIYNYLELRGELQSLGHRFETGTDTEVVLAAYAEWGAGCFHRFNGMWGLALLDLERRTLLLARDRFGVKPLYYRVASGRLSFASEVKAFTVLEDWKPVANPGRLLDFLVWNVADHQPDTFFEGVLQLPGGHLLEIDVAPYLKGEDACLVEVGLPRRWYELPPPPDEPYRDGADELQELLTDAVRLRLRSDVPVGSCLSGGLDSSSIVGLMSGMLEDLGGRVSTFTAVSAEPAFDESSWAKAVIEATGSTPKFITPTPQGLFEDLDALIWHQDEPFVSSSIYAQWSVFRAAHAAGVVVMLDGQGADETLCGYRGFFGAYLAGLLRHGRVGAWVREVTALRRQLGFSPVRSIGYTAAYLTPRLQGIAGRLDGRAYADRGWIEAGYRSAFEDDAIRRAGGRPSSVRAMSVAQLLATNLPMLLHWEDRNSMAFSVEARVPFLDYRVVELALQLDDSAKVGGGVSKAVLRRAMRGIIPDRVLDRRDKMGFVTAEPAWMKGELKSRFRRGLEDAIQVLPEILHPSILTRFDDMTAGRRPFDQRYWRVFCAGRWAAAFSVGSA